jgi:hypothetical protein
VEAVARLVDVAVLAAAEVAALPPPTRPAIAR